MGSLGPGNTQENRHRLHFFFLGGLLDRELSVFAVGSHGDCGTLEPAQDLTECPGVLLWGRRFSRSGGLVFAIRIGRPNLGRRSVFY